jgi:AraC-like DNA-binding protein
MGGELKSYSRDDFEVHTLAVGEEKIATICEMHEIRLPVPRLRPEVFRPPSAVREWLLGCYLKIQCLAGEISLVEFENFVATLVISWLGPQDFGRKRAGSARNRNRVVQQCLEAIESQGAGSITPQQLCGVAGTSARTLQHAFRERFDFTPGAFLKAKRLAAVREALRNANPKTATVGDLMVDESFWHVGQFAADYRRAFGEAPSATLKQSGTGR